MTSKLAQSVMKLIGHPNLHAAAGVALTVLAEFTSLVPASDRTTDSVLGLAYAVAVSVVDWLKAATA